MNTEINLETANIHNAWVALVIKPPSSYSLFVSLKIMSPSLAIES